MTFSFRCFVVGSKDTSTWVFGAERWANLIYYSLGGHKDVIVGCFFEKDSLDVSLFMSSPTCDRCAFANEKKELRRHVLHVMFSVVHGEPGRDAVCLGERHRAGRPRPEEEPGQTQDPKADGRRGGWGWGGQDRGGGRGHQRESWSSQREDDQKCSIQAEEQVRHVFIFCHVDIWKTLLCLNVLRSLCSYRHFFNKEGDFNNLTATAYHKPTHILVTGFASGIFHLHELPEFNLIHSLRWEKLTYCL